MTPIPLDWPHILFLRREAFGAALESGLLSSFDVWVDTVPSGGSEIPECGDRRLGVRSGIAGRDAGGVQGGPELLVRPGSQR